MRDLHVVGLSEDGQYVVLATRAGSRRGGFRLALDRQLSAAMRGEVPWPSGQPAPVATLTPRDIQSRLRAGESTEQIAASAGVPVGRVERFAGPVLAERQQVVQRALTAVLTRERRGESVLPLGEALDGHLRAHAAGPPPPVQWSARRLEDGDWMVEARWAARGRRRQVGWRYSLATSVLTAADQASASLGFAPPDGGEHSARPAVRARLRRRTSASAKPAPVRVSVPAGAKQPGKPATKTRTEPATKTRTKTPTKTPTKPATKTPTKPATKTATKPATAATKAGPRAASHAGLPKAATKAAPITAPKPARRSGSNAAPEPVTSPRPVRDGLPVLRVVRPISRANPARRAAVPGWADVLLSTSARRAAPADAEPADPTSD